MEKIIETVTSPTTRMWCYNVMIAVMMYLSVKGLINGDELAALNTVGAAFFAVASANVNRTQGKHEAQ